MYTAIVFVNTTASDLSNPARGPTVFTCAYLPAPLSWWQARMQSLSVLRVPGRAEGDSSEQLRLGCAQRARRVAFAPNQRHRGNGTCI